jgi:hypothetical protein
MSTTRPTTGTRLARALVCAMLGAGCGPQTGGGTVTPGTSGSGGSDPDPQGVTEGEGMGELRKRLGDLVDRERGLRPVATSDAGKCEELCELATSICSVQEKLCELADDHPDDDSYQGLCREARNECREAQESCVRCVETNQNQSLPPQ